MRLVQNLGQVSAVSDLLSVTTPPKAFPPKSVPPSEIAVLVSHLPKVVVFSRLLSLPISNKKAKASVSPELVQTCHPFNKLLLKRQLLEFLPYCSSRHPWIGHRNYFLGNQHSAVSVSIEGRHATVRLRSRGTGSFGSAGIPACACLR